MQNSTENFTLFRFVPTMRCNYRCNYCFLDGDTKSSATTLFDQHPAERWVEAMGRFANREVEFYMWGGEPFVLEGTYTLVRGFTGYDHVISGCRLDTNMYFAEKIARLCPTDKVKLNCSWHTQYDSFDSIFKKTALLHGVGMVGMLNFVASEQNMKVLKEREGLDIDTLIKRFDEIGVYVNIAADFSIVNGKDPSSYGEYEKLLRQYVCEEDWKQLRNLKTHTLCDANKHFFTVHANGDITPCLSKRVCGNFFEGTLNPPPIEECRAECPSIVAYPFRRDNTLPFRRHLPEYVERNRAHRLARKELRSPCAPLGVPSLLAGDGARGGAACATAKAPRVSVVLPTYNHITFLPLAVDSVLTQTFTDLELIIVNDGSTDGTREYLSTLTDPRVRVINQENKRLPEALNAGFREGRGAYLTWTSADNACFPNMLEELVKTLDAHPEAGFAYADFAHMDAANKVTGVHRSPDFSLPRVLAGNPGVAAFLYRRECQEAVGLYDPALEGAEDWDMWLRIREKFPSVYLPEVLYCYRDHAESMTGRIPAKIRKGVAAAIAKAIQRHGGNLDIETCYPALVSDRSDELRGYAWLDLALHLVQSTFYDESYAREVGHALENARRHGADFSFVTLVRALQAARSGEWQRGAALASSALGATPHAAIRNCAQFLLDGCLAGDPARVAATPLPCLDEVTRGRLYAAPVRQAPSRPLPEKGAAYAPTGKENGSGNKGLLAQLAEREGYDTDRGSYLSCYDALFGDLAQREVTLLEMGSAPNGGSLKLWRDYFSTGKIVGLAPHAAPFDDPSGRIALYRGAQDDAALLGDIAKEHAPNGFDIVIDDASHIGSVTKKSFWQIFDNHLKPGGFFIIEDWGTGYWPEWADGAAYQPGVPHLSGLVGFVKELVDEVARPDILKPGTVRMPAHATVKSLQIHNGILVAQKGD